jgi:molybdopterin-guanine dinucleotide biosynthesis protein B
LAQIALFKAKCFFDIITAYLTNEGIVKIVAFTGPSNSGKTTLIVKLCEFWRDRRVSVIKHDPKDKARFDVEGKDSFRFFASGANVAVVSGERTSIFTHESMGLEQLIASLPETELLLIEGLKTWQAPRIGVFRAHVEESYLEFCDAIAIDESVSERPDVVTILDLNDIESIAEWIEQNAQKREK